MASNTLEWMGDNIKVDPKNKMGLELFCSGNDSIADFCEHGYLSWDSIKAGEFLAK